MNKLEEIIAESGDSLTISIEKAIDIVRNSNKEDIILIFNDIELLINKNSMVNDIALIWYLKSKLRELNKDLC
ncbi:MAG TPA: hypothetical protein PLS10_09210 [Chitinophagales bacterium]|nr:hypothetical protein [Chitinophagales bacterium]